MATIVPRVRFAPSPTGDLHLGGARTALFNWLFARRHKGKYFLRIEDTDRLRSKDEFTKQICDSLNWLGLTWDGELIYQSKRVERYAEILERLLDSSHSYRCFCSKDDLAKKRKLSEKETGGYMYDGTCRALSNEQIATNLSQELPFSVRLKVPSAELKFRDQIYGEIKINSGEIDDFIVARSDGSPTYNLVVVIDDHDMGITHVIRGEDHVSNTPKQMVIYDALGFEIPEFAHLPMILGSDKRRLSKRHGASGIQDYCERGYTSNALNNYLALLGWNPDTEDEIFTLQELANLFSIDQVQKKPAVFDEKKLQWVSGQHMFLSTSASILKEIRRIDPDWRKNVDEDHVLKVIELVKLRAKSLIELQSVSQYFFKDPESYDEKASRKNWRDDSVNQYLETLIQGLKNLNEWKEENIESSFRKLADDKSISAGKLIHPVRLSLSGVSGGPSLFAMMELLGKKACISRIEKALAIFPKSGDMSE